MKHTLLTWIPTLAAVAVMLACARLAFWQLDRAEEKAALLEAWERAPATPLEQVDADTPLYSRVTASGRFDDRRQVLLDNQSRHGLAGVYVFTPFRATGESRLWLVNRGWTALNRRSGMLPDPPVPADATALNGILNNPPRVGRQIGRAASLDPEAWPNLVTYYDRERLLEVYGDFLAERVILLDPDHPAHLDGREWQPLVFGPARHRAYAFQWGLIGLVVFGIWLVLSIRTWTKL